MSIESKISSLITVANTKTGKTDADLTSAMQSLVDGVWWGRCADLPHDRGHGIHAARSMDCHHCPSVRVSQQHVSRSSRVG